MLLACGGLYVMPSRPRRALPWGATDIQEQDSDSRVGSDFQRCLRARIAESDFDGYAERLALTHTYSTEDSDLPLSWTSCNELWWNPPDSLTGARFEHENGDVYFAMAAFHNEYVYFVAFGW